THEGNSYTLDLGELGLGQPLPVLQFAIANEAAAPSDQIGGTFEVSRVAGFSVQGAALPAPIDAGQSYQGLVVGVNTGAFDQQVPIKFGLATELITFHPQDVNETGFSAAMPDITLEIKYTLTPPKEVFSYAWGDVHITTYDKLHYDFQAFGEFILADSRVPGDSFQIQMRLEHWAGHSDAVSIIGQAAAS